MAMNKLVSVAARLRWSVLIVAVGLIALQMPASELFAKKPNAARPSVDAGVATSYPARVYLIRHAEKPTGSDKSSDLTPEGLKRANALPQLFETSESQPKPLHKPDFIFAAAKSKGSNRSAETVIPLGKKLGIEVNTTFADNDYGNLVEELFSNPIYAGKTILISWHHGKIPKMAQALHAVDAPKKWSDDSFNRVWQIVYDKAGKATFKDRPQNLLESDKLQPVGAE